MKIDEVQKVVKDFAKRNGWEDFPNIDKFDHLHEELIAMSQHLRYKSREECEEFVKNNLDIFEDGIGDLLFGLMRLANQLGVNAENAFKLSSGRILKKYNKKEKEKNIVNDDPKLIT